METSYDLWAEIKKVEQIKLITNRQSAITQQRRRPFVFTELSFPPYEGCFYFFKLLCGWLLGWLPGLVSICLGGKHPL